MKNLLPLITFCSFRPTFMTVYHIPLQNIPEIWRVKIHAVPLPQKFVKRCNFIWRCCVKQKTRKQEGEKTTYNPARRTFMLDLTWKFNEARSKYRGSGAGEKQKARM